MKRVVLGLGSNFGHRLGHLRAAIRSLGFSAPARLIVERVSPLYESEAMLLPDAPASWNLPFLNLALTARTNLSELELLAFVKQIESTLGRHSRGKWSPREIDIDILDYEGSSLRTPELTLPHAGLRDRPFAILPFRDLAPDWLLQPTGEGAPLTVAELAHEWSRMDPSRVPFRTQRSAASLLELVGVINVTPDSFSDGGNFFDAIDASAQAIELAQMGAGVLDFGAESTRPGATPLTPPQEWERLEPVLRNLPPQIFQGERAAQLSLDTRHAETVATTHELLQKLRLDLDWINDVSGFADARMRTVAAPLQARCVIMHSLTVPASREQTLALEADPVGTVLEWAQRRIREMDSAGIARSRIIFDPGIGFGKTPAQSLTLLRHLHRFRELGVEILVGHSRKHFLMSVANEDLPPNDRDIETLSVTQHLARAGVDYARVHDVRSNRRSLAAFQRLDGVVQWSL
ncbi:MAG: dihydropteroate synthase [Bdellovibrionales bacterium]|nr:dihydropteroate synthase [Bdellovibrionales bacterium]